jgi:hypothetical protein
MRKKDARRRRAQEASQVSRAGGAATGRPARVHAGKPGRQRGGLGNAMRRWCGSPDRACEVRRCLAGVLEEQGRRRQKLRRGARDAGSTSGLLGCAHARPAGRAAPMLASLTRVHERSCTMRKPAPGPMEARAKQARRRRGRCAVAAAVPGGGACGAGGASALSPMRLNEAHLPRVWRAHRPHLALAVLHLCGASRCALPAAAREAAAGPTLVPRMQHSNPAGPGPVCGQPLAFRNAPSRGAKWRGAQAAQEIQPPGRALRCLAMLA